MEMLAKYLKYLKNTFPFVSNVCFIIRYREKKKAEQDAADMELTQLFDKNAELKRRLAEMEVEAKCLKKLMIDTGLGQYLNNTAAVF